MKLIAKKGTAFEQTVKQMCEEMELSTNEALDMVERAAGVRPLNVFHVFHWGTISRLIAEFDIHADDRERVNPCVLRPKKGCSTVFVPSLRHKEGKKFADTFRAYAIEHEIKDEPLNEYGINMVDWKRGVSHSIRLAHDKKKGRYMLICSNSIPESFDKKKLAKDQFDIEY